MNHVAPEAARHTQTSGIFDTPSWNRGGEIGAHYTLSKRSKLLTILGVLALVSDVAISLTILGDDPFPAAAIGAIPGLALLGLALGDHLSAERHLSNRF